jgi:hypothetical protein
MTTTATGSADGALLESDLPGLFAAADAVSRTGQHAYLVATATRNLLAVIAAAASFNINIGGFNWIAFVAAIAFICALGVETWLWGSRPEQRWYDGRALAESAKTLAWRYSIGAAPFPIGGRDADDLLLKRLAALLQDAPATGIAPTNAPPISDAMRRLRAAPLEQRRRAYLRGRVEDQCEWYRRRATTNSARARRWRLALLGMEIAGIVLAFCGAIWSTTWLGLAGVVAAVIAAAAAWLAVRQHEALARAYTFAHGELMIARERLLLAGDEAAWAMETADTEEAISREHTMWRASRRSVPI